MEKFVVTIGREFGSSGKEIGRELAWQLGVECYDRSMVEKAAEEAGIPPEEVAMADETVSSGANRIVFGGEFTAPVGNPDLPIDREKVYRRKIIDKALEVLQMDITAPTVFTVDESKED